MRNPSLIVLLSADSLSVTCSLLTLWTIYRVGRWNGYTQLIYHLALAQLFYDLSTVLVPLPGAISYHIYVGYRSIFGMVTTLLTNVITGTVVYTVYKFHAFEVSKYFNLILIVIYIPSIIVGLLVGIYVESSAIVIYSSIYFWVRVLSISFNILSYLFVMIILSNLKKSKNIHAIYQQNMTQQQGWNTFFKFHQTNSSNDPLRVFVRRFQYYPLIQVICRVAVSWYEYSYGYAYNYHSSDSLLQQILLFLYVIFLPSLGTFYFLIYLSVSPNAYQTFIYDLHKLLNYLSCGQYYQSHVNHSRDKSVSVRDSGGVSVINEGDTLGGPTSGRSVRSGVEFERKNTMMSLYRHFFNERISSVDRRELDVDMSTPLQRISTFHSRASRQTSTDPDKGSKYQQYDEEELSKEIQRVYENGGIEESPQQEMSLSSSRSS